MAKTKIKDMTPAQLKSYRKKQSIEKQKKKEKEKREEEKELIRKRKEEEKKLLNRKKAAEVRKKNKIKAEKEEARKATIRSRIAKKAAETRKKNKIKAEKEETKKAAERSKIAKKAAQTRKRNIIIAKKEIKEKDKAELALKREERKKNRIVVPRSKPIKDMTPEEYLEYKTRYAQIYNEKKRKAKEKEVHKNVSRRLSGKALDIWNNNENENFGRKFSEIKENARYIMHPKINNKTISFGVEGIDAYCEITAAVNISVFDKRKTAEVSLNFFVLPKGLSSSHLIIRDFWTHDVSHLIPDLTDRNFHKILQPITNEQVSKIMQWSTKEFIHTCICNSQRCKQSTSKILWQVLDIDYAKKNDISFDMFLEISKLKKKRVKKKQV